MKVFVMKVFVMAAVMAAAIAGSASAQTASACLVVSNSWYPETKQVSVLVNGYGEHFWAIANMTAVTLTYRENGALLRGASFTISIYDGGQGSRGGALIETTTSGGPNHHVLWTFVPPQSTDERASPECRGTGYWLALIHG